MVKKLIYIILILLFGGLFLFMFSNSCYATDIDVVNVFNGSQGGNVGIDKGMKESRDISTNIIANFILLFRIIGYGTAIIMLLILGAKFMLGSIEQRAEIKKHLVTYVLGVIVLFGGAVLLGYLQEFMKNFG